MRGVWKWSVLLLLSCGTLKKEVITTSQKVDQETSSSWKGNAIAKKITISNDSSQTAFEIELYPKGRFSYTAANGFEGEATKLRIKQNFTKVSTNQTAEEMQTQVKGNSQQLIQEKNVVQTKHVKRSSANWMVWLLFLLVGILFWWFRKRLKIW